MKSTVSIFRKPSQLRNRNVIAERFKDFFSYMRRNRMVFAGFIITMFFLIISLLDQVVPWYLGEGYYARNNLSYFINPNIAVTASIGPTFSHGIYYILGTTYHGIALFPALLDSFRIDVASSLFIVILGGVIGLIIGSISGYFGGVLDEILMRITDIFYSIPVFIMILLFALAISIDFRSHGIYLNGVELVSFALLTIWWPRYARLARSKAIEVKNSRYVESAKVSGMPGLSVVWNHVIPNAISPVISLIGLDFGLIVPIFTVIEFIGEGTKILQISQYTPEIGQLIYGGLTFIPKGIVLPSLIPVIFLSIFIIGINLFAEGLREFLNPERRR
ncbi:ABC transporter permease [Caldiplasma sukawensis]